MHVSAAALGGAASLRAIGENVPHRDRGERKKMGAIVPLRARLVDELDVRLVDQRRGDERRGFAPREPVPVSDLPKLVVEQDRDAVERITMPASKSIEEVGVVRLRPA